MYIRHRRVNVSFPIVTSYPTWDFFFILILMSAVTRFNRSDLTTRERYNVPTVMALPSDLYLPVSNDIWL